VKMDWFVIKHLYIIVHVLISFASVIGFLLSTYPVQPACSSYEVAGTQNITRRNGIVTTGFYARKRKPYTRNATATSRLKQGTAY